jgi:hypothetical protein
MLYSRSRARSRSARRLSWLIVLSLTSVALFAPGALVRAASVTPIPISDNASPTCAELKVTYGGGQNWLETKSDPPGNGTITVAGFGTITISNFVQSTSDTPGSFDWSSTFGIDAVLVKAGSDKHNLYVYAPTADSPESTGDTGLRPQAGSGNGISHISFCYDASNPPPPSSAPPSSAPPSSAPPSSAPPSSAPGTASLLIAKVDGRGTVDPNDDLMVDGASFEVYLDDGDGTFDSGDGLVFGPAEADEGLLDTDQLVAGRYWIVEAVVPDGYIGSDPILVELNTDPSITCAWDAGGLIECEENTVDVDGLSWTIVIVDNAAIDDSPAPTGGVGGATGTPGVPGVTLPPTDTLSTGATVLAGDGWRLILLAMAGLMAAALLVTPATAVVRKDRRR